jgi:Tse3 toxin immunity protein Tsi3
VYRVDYDIGGGMHGTEGELVGRMEIDGRALSVTCRDQKEELRPEPEWCFSYLGTLAIAAHPQ